MVSDIAECLAQPEAEPTHDVVGPPERSSCRSRFSGPCASAELGGKATERKHD
jgi:hypothetical protein